MNRGIKEKRREYFVMLLVTSHISSQRIISHHITSHLLMFVMKAISKIVIKIIIAIATAVN